MAKMLKVRPKALLELPFLKSKLIIFWQEYLVCIHFCTIRNYTITFGYFLLAVGVRDFDYTNYYHCAETGYLTKSNKMFFLLPLEMQVFHC